MSNKVNAMNEEVEGSVCVIEEPAVLAETTLTFEENRSGTNCEPYGCTCISHEKCCGCFVQ